MYPATYYSLFPAFPRSSTVFVAMSFEPRFDFRWRNVLQPAISSVTYQGAPLEAVRVDARVVGDSILTEILQGIGTAQIIIADVSTIRLLEERPIRNGNVMYEVGLAHAVRIPEEVLLFRSDNDQLPFDTANVRINTYNPDANADEAREKVAGAIQQALKEVDLRKHMAVKASADSLDYSSFEILMTCRSRGEVAHPERKTMGDALSAVSSEFALQRLLSGGLIRAQVKTPSHEELSVTSSKPASALISYVTTTFGEAVLFEVANRFDFSRLAEIVQKSIPAK